MCQETAKISPNDDMLSIKHRSQAAGGLRKVLNIE